MQNAWAHLRSRALRVKGMGEARDLGGVMLEDEVMEAGTEMLGGVALAVEAIGG